MSEVFPRSEANFSLLEEHGVPQGDGPDPDVPEFDRIVIEKVLGVGGMGRVLLARDLRLKRHVALKEVLPTPDGGSDSSRTALEARLAREAWITSQLEHPGILPIYDIGTRSDGTLYYTMPLVQGESLAVIISKTGIGQRMTLLRRFLEACEAVASAHRAGVVHRDLKPENIMLVEGGGTRVVDWGLACFLSEALETRRGVVGTPRYMSPEQREGRPVDRGADVWSLGATLHELLVGQPWMSKSGHHESTPVSTTVMEGIPPELRAILNRALANRPDDRYADAGAMAEDLARFLDGRRVGAHDYSARELLVRFLKEWKVPIIVAAVGALTIGIIIILALVRLSAERDRAVEAEKRAGEALEIADHGLSRSLASQARLYAERGATPEAEVVAAHALRISDSPAARGVLLGTSAHPRPERVYSARVSNCLEADIDEGGNVFACRTDEAVELWQVEPAKRLWRRTAKARGIGLSGTHLHYFNENRFVVWAELKSGKLQMEMATGCGLHLLAMEGRLVNADSTCVWSMTGLEANPERFWPCDSNAYMGSFSVSRDGTRWAAGCSDGKLIVGRFGEEWRRDYDVPYSNPHIVMALAFGHNGELILGTNRGEVRTLELESGILGPVIATGLEQVQSVQVSGAGLVLAESEFGSAVVLDVAQQRRRLVMPSGARAALHWKGERLVEIREGELAIWELPNERIANLNMGDGITSVDFDSREEYLVVTHADGVGVWHIADGSPLLDMRGLGVVKAGIFAEDDGVIHLASSNETPGVREINLELGLDITSPMEYSRVPGRRRHDGRRIVRIWNGWYLTLSYSCGVGLHPAEPEALDAPRPCMLESTDVSGATTLEGLDSHFSRFVDMSSDGHEIWLLEQTRHAVWWLSPDLLWFQKSFDEPGALAISAAQDGRILALAVADGVVVRDGFTGDILRFHPVPVALSDVAVSPEGRWIVAGGADGSLWVWDGDSGELVAKIDAHRERISALRFSRDGRWLVSGAWDGQVRFYDLGILSLSAADLASQLERAWGVSLEDVQAQGDREP